MGVITTVCLDADDTLWNNLSFYRLTEERFQAMLADYASPEDLGQRLLDTEKRNLKIYGFGIKGFTLSMIETAVQVTQGRAPGHVIAQILEAGREMLAHPVDLLPFVEDAIETLSSRYKLVLVTKGDLLDQERKIAASGLGERFSGIEIVSDKNPDTYRRVFRVHAGEPRAAVMVGNSMKSDVVPALAAGGAGVFVPHEIEWSVEHDDEPVDHARYRRIDNLGQLGASIQSLE